MPHSVDGVRVCLRPPRCPPLLHRPSSSPKRGVACRLANQSVAPYDVKLLSVFDPCLHVHFQPGLHLTFDLHDDLDQV